MAFKVDLEKEVAGILPKASGGTGSSSGPAPSGDPNLVYATPDGSSGTAALRLLVVHDLPNPIDGGTF